MDMFLQVYLAIVAAGVTLAVLDLILKSLTARM